MVWNVIYESVNEREITIYNVFNHGGFYKSIKDNYSKNKNDREQFDETLRRDAMYYFWSKCEWEVVVTAWPPREDVEEKIDVYDQLILNWHVFTDYVWNNAPSEFKKRKSDGA